MKPRYYQLQAFEKIRESFKNKNNHICLMMSGGAGKSLLCKMILDSAVNKGSSVAMFSFRKSLTEQIKKYNLPNCDVGTLQKFGKKESEKIYDLVIFDEKDFHDTKLKNNIRCKKSITLSGFPTDANGFVLDYDDIVEAIQFPELVEKGYAKQIKVMSVSNADTSNLKKQGDGFNIKQCYELMQKPSIKKNILEVYKKYCINRKTLLFAVDTNHAENLKNEFIKDGILCNTIHSKKTEKENNQTIKDFEDNKIDLIINVVMISIGVDIPCINTILFARPMSSVPLFMQCVWRGTRKYNDDYCLVLDCAEVLKRCDFHPMQKLDINRKKQDKNKMCKCGLKFKLINRTVQDLSQYEYSVISDYKCDCGNTETVENIKLINMSLCEGCGQIFESKGGLIMTKEDKSINFDLECKCCGHKRKFREILLSDEELKEIKYNEAFKSDKWEDVEVILKAEVKKDGFKWQYAIRLLDHLKMKMSPIEAIQLIKQIRSQNKKISRLMYC